MFRIGICDMDSRFVDQLVKTLEELMIEYARWEAVIFEDSDSVVNAIKDGTFRCNLLFMDIFQKNGSGMEIAGFMHKNNVKTDIIFVTASREHVTAFDGQMLQVGEYAVPISRRYKDDVKAVLSEAKYMTVDEILDDQDDDNSYPTSGLFHQYDTKGALVCIKGEYLGRIIRVVPEQIIVVGRDGTSADMIVNLPLVSRKHCQVIYHEKSNTYEVTDYSTNGTFTDGDVRLEKNRTYIIMPGATLMFGDKSVVYKLG